MSIKLEVDIGEPARTYRIGDYLNAIDDLTCHFTSSNNIRQEELADALELYAKHIREG